MSKITFRADDDLVERLESCDASKSEVMREALRVYLDDVDRASGADAALADGSVDAVLADRIDELVSDRIDHHLADRPEADPAERTDASGLAQERSSAPDGTGEVTVNVTLDVQGAGDGEARTTREPSSGTKVPRDAEPARKAETPTESGTPTEAETPPEAETEAERRKTHAEFRVQTPDNVCGGCGEDVPTDHVYCPNCGEKRSHRAFCECGDEVRTDWSFCPGCGRRTPAADVLRDR